MTFMEPEIINTTDTVTGEKLACESCGAEFTCNAGQETCWCFDVKVAPEDLTALKENFNNCLCRACLEKIRAGEEQ